MLANNNETKMILEMWEHTREFVPEKRREDYLIGLFSLLADFNIFVEDLPDLRGEDKWIDLALSQSIEVEIDDDEDELPYD